MSAPSRSDDPPTTGALAAQPTARSPRQRERAQHLGTSLALVGVMLIFLGAMLGAELRELRAWHARSLREVATLAAARLAEAPASSDAAYASSDVSLELLDVQRSATHAFERALLVASMGCALAALTLVLRRGSWWATAAVLALACLLTSTHLYSVARAQLTPLGDSTRE